MTVDKPDRDVERVTLSTGWVPTQSVVLAPFALEPLDAGSAPVASAAAEHHWDDAASTVQSVTCPRCGLPGDVDVARRDAADFCRRCDYPLFWAVTQAVAAGSDAGGDDARRRLPGTAGAETVASVACPHCAEPNPPRAQLCVRCGREMVIRRPPPPVVVPVAPPPPPAPEPEEPSRLWLWFLVIGLVLIAAISVILLVVD